MHRSEGDFSNATLKDLTSADWSRRFAGAEFVRRLQPDEATVVRQIAATLSTELDADVRGRLLSALTNSSAASVMPELCRLLTNPKLLNIERSQAEDLLAGQGDRAVPPISAALRGLDAGQHVPLRSFRDVALRIGPGARPLLGEFRDACTRAGYPWSELEKELERIGAP
jgi:hypothetical protein